MTEADRLKLSQCPPWCETRHNEWDVEAQGHDGPSWPTVDGDDGSSVDIATVQNENGDVVVWLDAQHGVNLTPGQAREAGLALLGAAFWADDHRTT
jgi:hypothetical protein